jgi:uncharacterized Zn finger protein
MELDGRIKCQCPKCGGRMEHKMMKSGLNPIYVYECRKCGHIEDDQPPAMKVLNLAVELLKKPIQLTVKLLGLTILKEDGRYYEVRMCINGKKYTFELNVEKVITLEENK